MPSLDDIRDEYSFLDADDRYRLLIDLGRQLEPMPDALKTEATLVRGCSAAVWVYPTQPGADGRLHFLADSNAAITKGIIALVLLTVQDRPAAEIAAADIEGALAPFDLRNQLSSNRTQGIPNMIALIRETAQRYAGA
jgi:cysteine desulfuration protein SufE